jgi:DNA polymerase-3 subunit alpha
VLFFPKSYVLVSELLVEDNVVAVKGRLNERDGSLSLFGSEITPLDVSAAEYGGKPPIQLTIPERRIDGGLVSELKRALKAHPGDTPVRLMMTGPRKSVLFELGFLVDPDHGFASEIKGMLGPGAWTA